MKLRLAFLSGAYRGHSLEFVAPRTFVLGRSATADLQLYDAKLSRRHCAIKVDREGVQLKDLGSVNGTFVNSARVGLTWLRHGDRVLLGDTEIEIAVEASGDTVPMNPPVVLPLPAPAIASPTPPVPAGARSPPGSGRAPVAPAAAPTPVGPTCEVCRQVIPPDEVANAAQRNHRYVCATCRGPRIEIPGVQLGRCLGEGAMGAVFEARTGNGAVVAIKVLKLGANVSDEDRKRFYREAETAAALDHPNVVRVLGQGEAGTALYLIMEFVRGESLRKQIDRLGPLPVPLALHVTRQIAAALDLARERQIVHRDVKPENILVTVDGIAKLADFGLAKSIGNAGFSGLTRRGEGMGTLPYMPPEQIDNALEADHRSDIYSLGATLYHMLTGRKPFTAKTNMDFFMKIMSDPPPPIENVRHDVPAVVAQMVYRCMKKKPAERYQTAGEIITLVNQLLAADYEARETTN
jgi:hypothetical protein